MDSQRFDDLSRSLSSGSSRRSLIRGMFAAAASAVALSGRGAVARGGTLEICHKTWAWSTDWRIITVNASDTRKINSHLEHGDVIDPDYSSDPTHCGGCGNTCTAPANASAYCEGGSCGFTCNHGYDFNPATGTCDPWASFCTSADTPCANGAGFCATNVDSGDWMCVTSEGDCIACSSNAECDAGWYCVDDGRCGYTHCHPFVA